MRSLTANILFFAWAALAVASGASAQAGSTESPQIIHLQPFHGPHVSELIHFGNCQWLHPRDEPNETLLSEPDYQSTKRVYYAARYGDAADNMFTLVIDENRGTGTGFNIVYADVNNDNRIDPDRERFGFRLGTTSEAEPVRITLSVIAGGKTLSYAFEFTAFPYKDRNNPVESIHANCRNSSIMMGEAVFGGKSCKVAMADLDSNGLFNDYEQGLFRGDRFFADLNGDGTFGEDSENPESFSYAQYASIGGKWHTVEASPDGGVIQIRPAAPSFGIIQTAGPVKFVGLSSPRQFQRVEFTAGRAQALTGTYQMRGVTLEIVDSVGQRWNTGCTYRPTGPTVAIEPNQETTLADGLPVTIQVAVTPGPEAGVIELLPQITDRHGGSFSTIRKDNQRHEPPAHLVIKDAQGKQIAEAALEYG